MGHQGLRRYQAGDGHVDTAGARAAIRRCDTTLVSRRATTTDSMHPYAVCRNMGSEDIGRSRPQLHRLHRGVGQDAVVELYTRVLFGDHSVAIIFAVTHSLPE